MSTRITLPNGKMSKWISDYPTEKELSQLSIDTLSYMAKRKMGYKKVLIKFLIGKKVL